MPQTGGGRGSMALPGRHTGGRRIAARRTVTDRTMPVPAGGKGSREAPAPHHRTPGNPMAIELDKDVRDRAIASLQRYFTENMDEPIGNIQAGALLHFFIEDIAPAIYNLAIADAQERLHARVAELDLECHEEPFEYWKKQQPGRKR
jgi:uncharacterized protein (DUF2164 family)